MNLPGTTIQIESITQVALAEQSVAPCGSFRADTETCRTGCSTLKISRGDACPFDVRGNDPSDLQTACPCYV